MWNFVLAKASIISLLLPRNRAQLTGIFSKSYLGLQNQLANQPLKWKLTTELGETIDLFIRFYIRVFVVKSLARRTIKDFAGNIIGNIWKDLKE